MRHAVTTIRGSPMSEFTMGEAMSALDPHFDELDRICRTGLATYHRIPAEFKVEHSSRAQAACVYDHMVAEAERTLSQKPGVVFKEFKGLKVWIVADTATVRFKKMDEDGRTRNYPTAQTRTYDRQLPLPGFPLPPVNLVVGYWPDPARLTAPFQRAQ